MILLLILGYLVCGILMVGLTLRFTSGLDGPDQMERAVAVLFWPMGLLVGFMAAIEWLVGKIAGK